MIDHALETLALAASLAACIVGFFWLLTRNR